MARVTVDDCMQFIPNRFQMTLAATYRARQITAGATPMIDIDRDKPTVIAPVSYTHLDVYKRQAHRFSSFRSGPDRSCPA